MKSKQLLVSLKFNPNEEQLIYVFTKDMRNTGHLGTEDFQVTVKSNEDFEKVKTLIEKSYNKNRAYKQDAILKT
ncbi:MAG: hypothetical protein RR409_04855 [Clostridium sp.]